MDRRGQRDLGEMLTSYAFIGPSVIGVFLFLLLPVVMALGLSFFSWNYLDAPEFVGLDNYQKLAGDGEVANGLKVTAWYILLHIPIQTALAIFIAVQLNKHIRGRGAFRALFVLPWLTTPVVMGIVWNWLLDPTNGAINRMLGGIGIGPVEWLTDPMWAMPAIAMMTTWQWTGYQTLFFLSGLQSIPRTVYEAAEVDGASRRQVFWGITMPLLRPMTFFVIVTSTIASAQIFDVVSVMTPEGGPKRSTAVINYLIWENAFRYFDAGYGSALAMLLFVIILIVTALQFLYFRRRTTYDLG
jgi:multiple sugar transport system permease protein/sn-glycerol 3-phosphate transport system permease protein